MKFLNVSRSFSAHQLGQVALLEAFVDGQCVPGP
jgi:hypothetical protein